MNHIDEICLSLKKKKSTCDVGLLKRKLLLSPCTKERHHLVSDPSAGDTELDVKALVLDNGEKAVENPLF
jgi:hypothetical protein